MRKINLESLGFKRISNLMEINGDMINAFNIKKTKVLVNLNCWEILFRNREESLIVGEK